MLNVEVRTRSIGGDPAKPQQGLPQSAADAHGSVSREDPIAGSSAAGARSTRPDPSTGRGERGDGDHDERANTHVTDAGEDVTWGELHVGSRSSFAGARFTEVSRPTLRRVAMRINF